MPQATSRARALRLTGDHFAQGSIPSNSIQAQWKLISLLFALYPKHIFLLRVVNASVQEAAPI